jgi:SulP family sulfate permease
VRSTLAQSLPGLRLLRDYRREWLRSDVVAGVVLAAYLLPASLGDASLAGGDAGRSAALASATAVMVAVLGLAAWLLRAGSLVSFISETVMTGFKTGVALHLASTQLPKILGFRGSHGDFWERTGHVLTHLGETNATSLALGALALALLILGKWRLPNRPVSLLVLAAGIAAVPCFLLGAVETAAIGRMFARKHGYRLDSNQELLAQAGANLAAGLGRGFPVSGGMSQSLVNEGGGARTALSGPVAAGIMAVVALFLTGLLRDLPQPVLAAIVLMAVSGLFKLSELRRLWRFSRAEFAVAAAAILGVLGSGLLRGVLIGVVISLLLLLRRASRPRTTELGRVPGTDYFADAIRHPENERVPDVFVFRAEASLLYFNVEHVRDRFFELLGARGREVRRAVFFLGSCPGIDLAGVELLEELDHALRERGIAFRLAEARGDHRETLRRAGFEQQCFPVVANQPVATVLSEWPDA